MAVTDHLERRGDTGYYRYVRRVPTEVAHLERRKYIREGLDTKDRSIAVAKAKALDIAVEAHWAALLAGTVDGDEWARHATAIRLVKSMGFVFRPSSDILATGSSEVIDRLLALFGREDQKPVVQAVLGTVHQPKHQLATLFELYLKCKGVELAGYSPSQLKKHKQPKERAAKYLLAVVGNKSLDELTRADAIRFKEWWSEKMIAEDLSRDAPNRSFTDIQGMLTVIDSALQTSYRLNWSKLHIKATRRRRDKKRAAYAASFVQDRILAPGALDGVNFEARMIFYATIETGARPSEICNLEPSNIRTSAEVPHIVIAETDNRILKTENAPRVIPLVGVSLWALRQCPDGFKSYRDNEDSFSATINKALERLKLRPTPQHTAYSIRHTFQDRILAAGAGDRLQADLMGHEFDRPSYGEGTSLQQKLELLEKIKFQWPA